MPMTVRLDPDVSARLDRVAARRGTTRSELVREALAHLIEADESRAGSSFYDDVAHVIGSIDTGGKALSEKAGQKFRELLQERRARSSG